MASEPDNLVLVLLRKIDERTGRIAEDLHDLKVGVTAVEEGMAGVNRRLDRLEIRVERIERRLELTDATH
jgi:archaellum component FlaC